MKEKNIFTRGLALLLTLIMIVGMVPTSALAADVLFIGISDTVIVPGGSIDLLAEVSATDTTNNLMNISIKAISSTDTDFSWSLGGAATITVSQNEGDTYTVDYLATDQNVLHPKSWTKPTKNRWRCQEKADTKLRDFRSSSFQTVLGLHSLTLNASSSCCSIIQCT